MSNKGRRLLVISNNVLSETNNNGKTIYSYIDSIPCNCVRQLYFSEEKPTIIGYKYYKISDIDVIKGRLFQNLRGCECYPEIEKTNYVSKSQIVPKNTFTRLLRELIWYHGWKSKKLLQWLDNFLPNTVFFHAGDSMFAYSVFQFIVNRYHSKASIYITDDYFLPPKNESILHMFRRKMLISALKDAICHSNEMFTISENMRLAYKSFFNKDSCVIMNMTESLRMSNIEMDFSKIQIIYAGSLYFGRTEVLEAVATAVREYNSSSLIEEKKAYLKIFTNSSFKSSILENNKFVVIGGKIDKETLKKEYNMSDILLFIESFDESNIEKTKFSISTKIPEYLSLHKPIFAVGPRSIASIQYLEGVSCQANSIASISRTLSNLLKSKGLQEKLSNAAYQKYKIKHNKDKLQCAFMKKIF